ncbi:protein FAM227B-like isoform X2 [Liolophura sinensis]|uniref:protein FAM227B-like isoform X2 n=1 Tax=Liolophura sinensis TaxID=3198878 RepID=UPI0031586E97
MENFNRLGSPMELCEETLDKTTAVIEKRRKCLEAKQRTKSPFMIGSIDDLNHKIAHLDRRLQNYNLLVADSRNSDRDDWRDRHPSSAKNKQKSEQLEKERKEINQFAGMYCVKSTFTPGLSERARNISKITFNHNKHPAPPKKETGKPKFVELHQYPGYELTEICPLPDDIPALQILRMVTEASVNLSKKPVYQPVFERLFYSDLSQALLCDLFWYIFLEKFQPSQHSQQRLFNRVAHNYVKLLMYAKSPEYRDTFFKYYPSLMSQGVYAAYCEAFPDSYRQFGETFKEDVVCLVTEWMTGTKPAHRSWMKWNLGKLEPENIKMREEILNQQKNKKSSSVSFDFLDNLGGTSNPNLSIHSSNSNLNQSSSISSLSSKKPLKKHLSMHNNQRVKFSSKSLEKESGQPHAASTPRSLVEGKSVEKPPKQNGVDPHQLTEALTPIREQTTEDKDHQDKTQKKCAISVNTSNSLTVKTRIDHATVKSESHPACKGPEFVRSVFNVQGQSPLVAHFLRMNHLESTSGTILKVQRTELENLPSLDAPTYRDVIRQSYKVVTDISKRHQLLLDKANKESLICHRRQRKILRDHINREAALLSKPREVKRLSDLLILEQKKDQDSISAGADAAIEAALVAGE